MQKINGTMTAGGAGAVIGGIAGLAAGLGAIAIPGVGPAVAGGALTVAIGAAGVGAAAGCFVAALTSKKTPVPPREPTPTNVVDTPPADHLIHRTPPTGLREYLDGIEMAPRPEPFEDLEHEFRSDFTARKIPGYTWEQFSPAYRLGYNLANDPRLTNETWLAIEDYARNEWERNNPGTWNQFKDVVRYAWQLHKSKHYAH